MATPAVAAEADISPCVVVHVPPLGAVVAGDAAYDRVHPVLGPGGPDQWARWTASIDTIEALAPRVVVAGHRPAEVPDEDPARVLGTTRAHIRDFAAAAGSAASAQDLVAAMQQRYPRPREPHDPAVLRPGGGPGRTRPEPRARCVRERGYCAGHHTCRGERPCVTR